MGQGWGNSNCNSNDYRILSNSNSNRLQYDVIEPRPVMGFWLVHVVISKCQHWVNVMDFLGMELYDLDKHKVLSYLT